MPTFWRQCLRGLLFLPLVLAAPAPAGHVSTRALTPDNDPFYVPPPGFASTAPGTILRSRAVISSSFGLIPSGVATYQLLFRTTATNGSAIAGVTTVFKPVGAMLDRFVSFQTAYDGSATICEPSYSYQLLTSQEDLVSNLEYTFLEAYLLSGYIVSAPDYEGPEAAFSAARLAGMVGLDSMRAVINFKKTLGFSTAKPRIVGVGYSGGAIGTGWAASLHPTYAPELQVAGWAQGGTPANLTGTALFLDDTTFSGFLIAAMDGLLKPSAFQATLSPLYDTILTPYARSILSTGGQTCGAEDLLLFAQQSVLSTTFQSLGDQLLYQAQFHAVFQQLTMGQRASETPIAPVYMYHATPDEIIPYADASTLVDAWCGYGASVDFVTFAAGGHVTTEVLGFPGVFQFVQAAFAGTVAKTGCSRSTTLSDSLDLLSLGANLEPVLTTLVNALAVLGKEDAELIQNVGILKQSSR